MSPLQKYLNIQLYNNKFFKLNSPLILQPSRDHLSNPIDEEAFKSHTQPVNPFLTTKELCHKINASACPIEEILFSPARLAHLHIQESKHKLLFIKFIPVSTLRPCWYLIQVYLDSTLDMYPVTTPNVTYYCVFLAKHPNDIHKSNKFSRWCPECHKYSRYKDTNDIIYGRYVIIRPNQTPDSS